MLLIFESSHKLSTFQANLLRFVRCTCPPAMCTCVPTNDSTQVSCSCIPPEECACSAQEQQQDCIPICQDVCQAQCTGQTCGPLCQSICTDSCTSATLLIQQNSTATDVLPAEGDSSTSTLSTASDFEQGLSTTAVGDPTTGTFSPTSDFEQGLSTSAVGDPTTSTFPPTSDFEQGMSTSADGNNETENAQQMLSPYPQAGDQTTTDMSSQSTSSVIPLQTDQPLTPSTDQTTPSDPSDATDALEQESTSATQQPTNESQPTEQTVQPKATNETNPIQPVSYPGCTICFQFQQQPYQQTYQPYIQQPYYSAPQVYSMPQPQPQYYSPPQTYAQPQQACPSCMVSEFIPLFPICSMNKACSTAYHGSLSHSKCQSQQRKVVSVKTLGVWIFPGVNSESPIQCTGTRLSFPGSLNRYKFK